MTTTIKKGKETRFPAKAECTQCKSMVEYNEDDLKVFHGEWVELVVLCPECQTYFCPELTQLTFTRVMNSKPFWTKIFGEVHQT